MKEIAPLGFGTWLVLMKLNIKKVVEAYNLMSILGSRFYYELSDISFLSGSFYLKKHLFL